MALTACSTYHAKDLNVQALAQQNTSISNDQLHIQARQIKHPLLKPVPFDLSDGLSPDEVAILAIIQSPELRAARSKQGVANAQLLQAGLLPNPRLAYNYADPRVVCNKVKFKVIQGAIALASAKRCTEASDS